MNEGSEEDGRDCVRVNNMSEKVGSDADRSLPGGAVAFLSSLRTRVWASILVSILRTSSACAGHRAKLAVHGKTLVAI